MGTSQSVDEAPRDPNADLVERRATMRRLNPPQEVEVRTVSAVGEVSVGLIECSTAESLESLRAKIQSQLDGVPAQFVFLLWNRGRAPIGRRQEAQRAVLDVLLDGVVRIGAPGSQILPNSAREDASEALAAEPPKPAPLPRFVQASREISDKASRMLAYLLLPPLLSCPSRVLTSDLHCTSLRYFGLHFARLLLRSGSRCV
jgi:hypothetical protein